MTTRVRKPATSRTAANTADIAAARARTTLTRGVFLSSQGPGVIAVGLPMLGTTALMRRVDLLQLAKTDEWPEPLTAALSSLLRKTSATVDAVKPDDAEATIRMAGAIAKACIVVPPPEYLSGAVKVHPSGAVDIDAASARRLKPLFVDEDPDEDQVILDVVSPDEADAEHFDWDGAVAHGRMHYRDLMEIATIAYFYGPGGLGRLFRGPDQALEAVADVAKDEARAKRAARDRLPVGGA